MSQRSNNRKCLICWIAAIGIEDDEKNLVFKTRQMKQCNFIAKRKFPQNTIYVYQFCFWSANRYILRKKNVSVQRKSSSTVKYMPWQAGLEFFKIPQDKTEFQKKTKCRLLFSISRNVEHFHRTLDNNNMSYHVVMKYFALSV